MTDINGTIVIAEAIKNIKTDERESEIVSDLLCALCDAGCTVGEAFIALRETEKALMSTRLHVAEHGNHPEMEDSYAEGSD